MPSIVPNIFFRSFSPSLLSPLPSLLSLSFPSSYQLFPLKNNYISFHSNPLNISFSPSPLSSSFPKRFSSTMSSSPSPSPSTSTSSTSSSSSSSPRGCFIVFEGLDRAGKSTQCQKIIERFELLLKEKSKTLSSESSSSPSPPPSVLSLRFPDRTTNIGKLLNSFLQQSVDLSPQSVHLIFSANRWEHHQNIENHMKREGNIVISDRYSYSGITFSSAKGLSFDWCWKAENGLVRPDAVVFLSIDPLIAKSRGDYGSERFENETMQMAVRSQFTKMMEKEKKESEAGNHHTEWGVFDGNQKIEELNEQIWKFCNEIREKVKLKPIQTFVE